MPSFKAMKSPNNDMGVDEMISVIAHEIAEVSTNPLVNACYAGQDPSFSGEIADLCEGIYSSGSGGSYTGRMLNGEDSATYNMNGVRDGNGAEVSTNPLVNAWYAGQDPSFSGEIADLCERIYSSRGGGSYTGRMLNEEDSATYNMNGVRDGNGADK
ncbi:hypothetical protein MTR67_020196 [Solanum verrucosum]|uniref:Uncharacterized protein n=1 Tax=Solanum verrucosum TaxID=315347 RepID=A0AAF0TNY6_SOLVR|nr:hypothetical protein MTR67_020196 [Solanum verrucosum]